MPPVASAINRQCMPSLQCHSSALQHWLVQRYSNALEPVDRLRTDFALETVPPEHGAAQCRTAEYHAHYSLTENKTDDRAVASNLNRFTCTAFTGRQAFTCRISARVGPVPAVARSTGLRGCTAQHNGLYIKVQHAMGQRAACDRYRCTLCNAQRATRNRHGATCSMPQTTLSIL